jgi:2-methylcitrate dehydratase PrpD
VRLEVADAAYTLPTTPHKGSPHNPFTWDEICEKFRRYTREIISGDRAEVIIASIAHLEQTADMAEVARLLAVV